MYSVDVEGSAGVKLPRRAPVVPPLSVTNKLDRGSETSELTAFTNMVDVELVETLVGRMLMSADTELIGAKVTGTADGDGKIEVKLPRILVGKS